MNHGTLLERFEAAVLWAERRDPRGIPLLVRALEHDALDESALRALLPFSDSPFGLDVSRPADSIEDSPEALAERAQAWEPAIVQWNAWHKKRQAKD